SGQINSEDDGITEVDISKVNPVTRTVYVEEAATEDVLRVVIQEDTQSAITISSEDMHNLLVEYWNLSPTEAYLLMSVAGDVEICQRCKPSNLDVVTRFRNPKLENMTRLIK